MDTEAVVTQIEALTVASDEMLVLKFPEHSDDLWIENLNKSLQQTRLRNRFVIFVGDVEFAKVKRQPGAEIIMSDIAE